MFPLPRVRPRLGLAFLVLASGQVPRLSELAADWLDVVTCNSADDAGPLSSCGINTLNHTANLSFLMALDMGCCYRGVDGVKSGIAFLPNRLTPGATLNDLDFYGADQAVPSLGNTEGSLHADWAGDPLGVTCLTFPPIGGSCEGWPGYQKAVPFPSAVSLGGRLLVLQGQAQVRWGPFELARRLTTWAGAEVTTSVRMPFRQQAVLFEITVSNPASNREPLELGSLSMLLSAFVRRFDTVWDSPANAASFNASQFEARLHGCGRSAAVVPCTNGSIEGEVTPVVLLNDLTGQQGGRISSAVSFASDAGIHVRLKHVPELGGNVYEAASPPLRLVPGESWRLRLCWLIGDNATALVESAGHLRDPEAFAGAWEGTEAAAEAWWRQAFTPGNTAFSGHLPTLVTRDEELHRLYYVSVLSMLNTAHHFRGHLSLSAISPVAAQTMLYMWDSGYVAIPWSLLDPEGYSWALGMMLGSLGGGDSSTGPGLHGHMAVDARSGTGIGKWYAFNDYSFWLAADTHLRLQGTELLDTMLAGRPLREWLNSSALAWRDLVPAPLSEAGSTSEWLASYGDNSNLLEVVPTYQYVVPSLNLANAWMMSSLADYLDRSDDPKDRERAPELRQWAAQVQQAALGLYCEGQGIWACLTPPAAAAQGPSAACPSRATGGAGVSGVSGQDGWQRVPVRHVLDFVTAAQAAGRHVLPAEMKREMLSFHKKELRDGGSRWLRALSLDDPTASWASTHRDDHGPFGSWDGWVAKSAEALGLLGEWPELLTMLRQAAAATREGPFGQSHHVFMPNNTWAAQQQHKSGDWLVGSYFALCGGMFANTIIGTLFGVEPKRFSDEAGTNFDLLFPEEARGFDGVLLHVKVRGRLFTVVSEADRGLSFHEEGLKEGSVTAEVVV